MNFITKTAVAVLAATLLSGCDNRPDRALSPPAGAKWVEVTFRVPEGIALLRDPSRNTTLTALQHYPARPVVSVDTTGARDAFVAGLLWHLAGQGLPQDDAQLKECLERAQICGRLATTAKGAMTALPYLDQLQQQLV